MSVQAPGAVVLIRPHHFASNPETAGDNAFQRIDADRAAADIAAAAYDDATRLAEALEGAGITVHLFEDDDESRPDSVFPNNWFSTHAGGRIAVYPMFSPSRRLERRSDVLELLKEQYRVQEIVDYSGPRGRRALPRGHRRDGARRAEPGRVHGAVEPRRPDRARAVLHRVRLRADGLRRRARRRADLSHQRHDVHRHRLRARRARPHDEPRAPGRDRRAPRRAGARAHRAEQRADRRLRRQRDRAARHAGPRARALRAGGSQPHARSSARSSRRAPASWPSTSRRSSSKADRCAA